MVSRVWDLISDYLPGRAYDVRDKLRVTYLGGKIGSSNTEIFGSPS